jgi:hypothetical protein
VAGHRLDRTTLDWLTGRILDPIEAGERVGPVPLALLLRRYLSEARADLAEPLGVALARELDHQARQGCESDREEWLTLFSAAAAASSDPRLAQAAGELLPAVRRVWSDRAGGSVEPVMRSLEACLAAVHLPAARELITEAIDALERVVGAAYRPGAGMSHDATGAFTRGGPGDQVHSASALLTAFLLCGRLPYAMLADELMQSVLNSPAGQDRPFDVDCDAARVFCRLAALHRAEEYRRSAVLPPGVDYAHEAARVLDALAPLLPGRDSEAAAFGLALAEWLDLQ